MDDMRYDVEADWYLLYTCNLRCPYCNFTAKELGSKTRVYASPQAWKDAFAATGKTWLLHLTGGEPGIYPGFVELCEQLTESHYLSINSNLPLASLKEFAHRIDPGRVHFFNASLHYEVRRRAGALEEFAEAVRELRDGGFAVLVSQVMTPQVVRAYPEISKHLETLGIAAIPKVARGAYRGLSYPREYTAEERALILEYMQGARAKYEAVYGRMPETPTVDLLNDDRLLGGIPDYRGSLCAAGSRFVQIAPNGTVTRCGPPEVLGNLLAGDVRFFDGPRLCDTYCCGPYFCEKYAVRKVTDAPEPRPRPSRYTYLKSALRHERYLARTDGYAAALVDGAKKLARIR